MVASVPKAELHCHIEGAASPELVMQQGERYGVDTSAFIDPGKGYIWTDFTSFLEAYDSAAALFRSADDYILLTEDHYLGLAAQNCIYAEVFASPDHAARIGCSYTELIEAIATGIRNARASTGIEGRVIAGSGLGFRASLGGGAGPVKLRVSYRSRGYRRRDCARGW